MNFELAHGQDVDKIIEALMLSTFKSGTDSGDFGIDGTANTITRESGGTWHADLVAGVWILISGYEAGATANNGYFKILTRNSGTVLTLEDPDNVLVTQAGSANESVKWRYIRNGVTPTSLLVEWAFQVGGSLDKFLQFTGMRVQQMTFNAQSQALLGGTVQFQGKQMLPPTTSTVAGAVTAGSAQNPAHVRDVLSASANVLRVFKSGAVLTSRLRRLEFTVNNNPFTNPAIGSDFPIGVGVGFLDVSGRGEAYFEDKDLLDDMVNHTTVSLEIGLTDSASPKNLFAMTIPAGKFNVVQPNAGGGNEPVLQQVEIGGFESTDGYSIQIDRISG
jgi:hypothetical protein